MSHFEESSPVTGPVWSRFLSAGFPPAAPQRREAERATGFDAVSALRAHYLRDRLMALNPADLHPLRVEVDQLRAEKSIELDGRLPALDPGAPDTPPDREREAEVALLRATLAQLDVLDGWIAAAMDGKSLSWPPALWEGAAPRARLWDFHTTQTAVAEAWLDHVQGQTGAVPPAHAELRAQTLDRVLRHTEVGMLRRAIDALENAFLDTWAHTHGPPPRERIAATSGWAHQCMNLLDALLFARDLLKGYGTEEERLPLGVDPAERPVVRSADGLAHRVGVGLMRDRLFHHYEAYLSLETQVREAQEALRTGRFGITDESRPAIEDAHWLVHVLGNAYARYLDALDIAIGDAVRPSPLALDYRGRRPDDPRAGRVGPALVEEVRAGLSAIDAFMRDADARLALAEPSLADAVRALAPYAEDAMLGKLYGLAKQLQGGLRCRPQAIRLDLPAPRPGTPEPPVLSLGRTAARLTAVLAEEAPETRRRLAAENILPLNATQASDPMGETAARFFVIAGPGELALPVDD